MENVQQIPPAFVANAFLSLFMRVLRLVSYLHVGCRDREGEREGGREIDTYIYSSSFLAITMLIIRYITFGNQTWLGGNQPFSLLIFPAFSKRGFPSQIIQDYPSLSHSVG